MENAFGPQTVDDTASAGLALFTDLYELTMLQAYFDQDMHHQAVFSLAARRLPGRRNYLLACGLETVLDYLENLRFSSEDIDYLASLERFSRPFLDWLRGFCFTGEVRAVAEGTPLFANEPLLEVAAPLPEAQVIETFLMNQIHLQTVLCTKAHRIVSAAQGKAVVDFGPRRAHGIDAAVKAARAYHIAGVTATSNVLAGKRYGVPLTGTMAHSYIQAHDDELSAFRGFARSYPEATLLVDTYNTLAGVRKVITLASELRDGFRVAAVRLDSGDLLTLSRQSRQMLDEAGLGQVKVLASGGLDEDGISGLLAQGAPIDGFGVGTDMGVSSDAPALDIAYKLCEYAGRARMKLSSGKPVLPGRKQVFRLGDGGIDRGDVIAGQGEAHPGRPLLETVMERGRRTRPAPALDAIRDYARTQIERLPEAIRRPEAADPPYPVEVSAALTELQRKVKESLER